MELIAIGDKIIAKEIIQEITTNSGIILLEDTNRAAFPQKMCEVISIGSEVKEVKVGDRIYSHTSAGQVIAVSKEDFYCVFHEPEIYCVVK
jgi:co-chaperonin GroES (HSP10)